MTVVAAVVVAGLLLAAAWLLLAPIAVEGMVAGSLHDGATADLHFRFAPLAVHVHGSHVDVTIAGVRLPHSPGTGHAPHTPFHERWRLDDLLRVVVRHRRLLRVRRLDGDIRYGFEDPALTGQVHGLLAAAQPLLAPPAHVTFRADWSLEDVLIGRLDLDLRVFAGRLAMRVGWAVLTRSVRRRSTPTRRRRQPERSDTSRMASARAA